MTPFFSIIIPLYNKAKYIEDTLQSVLNQDFISFEIIIVDDGSTDNSVKIIEKFNDSRILLVSQENKGVASARNYGISHAEGQYIALIDADDFWYTNHLTALKHQITQFPEAGLFCNNYEVYLDENTKRPAQFKFDYDTECLIVKDYFRASTINSVAWTSAVAFSREKFYSLGGFNTNLDTSEDLDMWIRFALRYKISFNPCITMSYKYYLPDSLTKMETNVTRYNFINSYEEEKENASLKKYLDINRYAVAIRCKVQGEHNVYKNLKSEIKLSNLNFKQKILLNMPRFILVGFKKAQKLLIKNDIYISAFK